MSRFLSACLSALAFVLASCGGTKDNSTDKTNREGSVVRVPTAGGTATTIHLVVGGGPHAGTYDTKSDDITCTYGFAGKGSWGNQYSVMGKKGNEFSSLQLIVPDTKDAADGTDEFLITVAFGELMQPSYSEHTINTTKDNKEGSGIVTVDDQGKTGKVSFKGKTKDNVALDGTIDCHQLMRSDG